MSRSYKKNPYCTDYNRGSTKQSKRRANHVLRRKLALEKDMPSRIQHKKYTESWNICDYKWRMTKEEAIEWYKYHSNDATEYFRKRYPTLEDWLSYWEKCYKRK